jgi:serine/threonine-protein kinase
LGRSAEQGIVNELRSEREDLASIRHPTLLSIHDLVVEPGRIGVVTDLVEGSALRRHLTTAGPIAPAAATSMAADLADALAAAHACGVVHTGVTSADVIVDAADGHVRLADLATPRLTRRLAAGGAAIGTPTYGAAPYAAPELIRDERRGTPSDIYALGILLFEMLTGVTPYAGGSASDVLRRHLQAEPVWPLGMPSGLRYVLSRCLQHDPTARPAAAAVGADLRELSTHLGGIPAAPRPSPDTVRYRATGRAEEPPEPAAATPSGPRGEPSRPEEPPEPTVEPPGPRPAAARLRGLLATPPARGVAAALVLLVVVAGLAIALNGVLRDDGGQGGGNPAASDTTKSPPDGTGREPTQIVSTSPTFPASGTQRTSGGAIAFVAYWFDSLTYATGTGDVTNLVGASSPRCATCQSAATTIKQTYAAGGSLRGGAYLVRSLLPSGLPSSTQPAVEVVFDRSPRASVTAKRDVRGTLPGASFVVCRVQVEWTGERWRMLAVESPAGPIA